MTRTRLSLISTAAFASILGAAIPAFAQAPVPPSAPMMAPAPVMAPAMAPPPMAAPDAVMPVAPLVAPKAADDMSGSIGFGVGLVAGTSLVAPTTTEVSMKIWVNDALALVPRLVDQVIKAKDTDTKLMFAPALLVDLTLLKGASTRLNGGAGIGLTLASKMAPATTTDLYIGFDIPVQLAVEHFFARWFSISLGTTFNLVSFAKDGSKGWTLSEEISNIKYMGSLYIYTD